MTTTFYFKYANASSPMPTGKQSSDTITQDWAYTATYSAPGVMDKNMDTANATNVNNSFNEVTGTHYNHIGSWITNPLAAQNISGTVRLSGAGFINTLSSTNTYPRIYIYVWKANNTKGADILAPTSGSTAISTSWNIDNTPDLTINSTTINAGDKICVEVEIDDRSTSTATNKQGMEFAGNGGNFAASLVFSATIGYYTAANTLSNTQPQTKALNKLKSHLYQPSALAKTEAQSPGSIIPCTFGSRYRYSKSHVITSTADGAQTNYPIMMNLYRGSGSDTYNNVYLNNHSATWTSSPGTLKDIRFTNSSGASLDYWIESDDGTTAVVWVEIDSIPSSGGATIYMYYGRAGDAGNSNGANTFTFFDDFSGSSMSAAWSRIQTSGSTTVSGGAAQVSCTTNSASEGWVATGQSFSSHIACRFRSYVSVDANSYDIGFCKTNSGWGYDRATLNYGGSKLWLTSNDSGTSSTAARTVNIQGAYQVADINIRWGAYARFYGNGTYEQQITTNYPTAAINPYISCTGNGSAKTVYVDWYVVRKWTPNEPSNGAWGAETNRPAYCQLSFNKGQGQTPKTSRLFNLLKTVLTKTQASTTSIIKARTRTFIAQAKSFASPVRPCTFGSRYKYSKSHVITGTADGAQTNYPVMLVLYPGSGTDSGNTIYLNNHSLSWGSSGPTDIRFTNASGTSLPYYVETGTSTASVAYVWVNVDSIPANPSTTTIYMYYGRSGDAGNSNGANTFTLFDDFPGSSLGGQWTQAGGTSTISGGIITENAGGQVKSVSTYGTNTALRARVSSAHSGSSDSSHREEMGYQEFSAYHTESARFYGDGIGGPSPPQWHTYNGTTQQGTSIGTWNANTYYVIQIARGSSTVKCTVNDGSLVTYSANLATDNQPIYFQAGNSGSGCSLSLDWILLRKYTANEPTHTSTGAETNRPAYCQLLFNKGQGQTLNVKNFRAKLFAKIQAQTTNINKNIKLFKTLSLTNAAGYIQKFHTINGSPDSALNNYPIKLYIHRWGGADNGAHVYLDGNSLNWPYDIKMLNSDSSNLNFWREYSDNNMQIVWVKLDSIPQNGSYTLRMQFGNAGWTDLSNGANTFSFFDDFPGTSLSGQWFLQSTPTVSVSGSIVSVTHNASTDSGILSTSSNICTTNTAVRFRIMTSSMVGGAGASILSPNTDEQIYYKGGGLCSYGSTTNTIFAPSTLYGWQTLEIQRSSTTAVNFVSESYGYSYQCNTNIYTSNEYVAIYNYLNDGSPTQVDWMLVRPFTPNEPTHGAWGYYDTNHPILCAAKLIWPTKNMMKTQAQTNNFVRKLSLFKALSRTQTQVNSFVRKLSLFRALPRTQAQSVLFKKLIGKVFARTQASVPHVQKTISRIFAKAQGQATNFARRFTFVRWLNMTQGSQELCPNGTFENGVYSWGYYDGTNNDGSLTWSTDWANTGTHSMKVTSGTPFTGNIVDAYFDYPNSLNGVTYTLTCTIKAGTAGTYIVGFHQRSPSYHSIGVWGGTLSAGQVQAITITGVNDNTGLIGADIYLNQPSGYFYIDDVSMKPAVGRQLNLMRKLTQTEPQSPSLSRLSLWKRAIAKTQSQVNVFFRKLSMFKTLQKTQAQTPGRSRLSLFKRSLSQTQAQARNLAKTSLLKRLLSQTQAQAKNLMRITTWKRLLSKSQAQANALARKLALFRPLPKTQGQTPGRSRLPLWKRLFAKSESQTPAIARLSLFKRALARAQGQANALARKLALFRPLPKAQGQTQAFNRLYKLARTAFAKAQPQSLNIKRGLTLYRKLIQTQAQTPNRSRLPLWRRTLLQAQAQTVAFRRLYALARTTFNRTQAQTPGRSRLPLWKRVFARTQAQSAGLTRLTHLYRTLAKAAGSVVNLFGQHLGGGFHAVTLPLTMATTALLRRFPKKVFSRTQAQSASEGRKLTLFRSFPKSQGQTLITSRLYKLAKTVMQRTQAQTPALNRALTLLRKLSQSQAQTPGRSRLPLWKRLLGQTEAQTPGRSRLPLWRRMFGQTEAQTPGRSRLPLWRRTLAQSQAQATSLKRALSLFRSLAKAQAQSLIATSFKLGGQLYQRTLAGAEATNAYLTRRSKFYRTFAGMYVWAQNAVYRFRTLMGMGR